ncbi:MAG TPA: hypothetical protein VGJ70_11885 [Solirubrobacteraceae bacterium]
MAVADLPLAILAAVDVRHADGHRRDRAAVDPAQLIPSCLAACCRSLRWGKRERNQTRPEEVAMLAPPLAIGTITLILIIVVVVLLLGGFGFRGRF